MPDEPGPRARATAPEVPVAALESDESSTTGIRETPVRRRNGWEEFDDSIRARRVIRHIAGDGR